MSDDNSTIDVEMLRDIMSASMEGIPKSTTMLGHICIMAIETARLFDGR
jgi:hypothetical protein